MGEKVICTTGDYIPVKRVYYQNGSIYDDNKNIEVKVDPKKVPNLSILDSMIVNGS